MVITATVICVILFFFHLNSNTKEGEDTALLIYYGADITIHGILLIAVIIAMVQFTNFKHSYEHDNSLDALLLLISLSGAYPGNVIVNTCHRNLCSNILKIHYILTWLRYRSIKYMCYACCPVVPYTLTFGSLIILVYPTRVNLYLLKSCLTACPPYTINSEYLGILGSAN